METRAIASMTPALVSSKAPTPQPVKQSNAVGLHPALILSRREGPSREVRGQIDALALRSPGSSSSALP